MPGFDPMAMFYHDLVVCVLLAIRVEELMVLVLQYVYREATLLFYDGLGGNCIGGIWQPNLKHPLPFRVLGEYSSIPAVKVCHWYYCLWPFY